MYCFNRFVMILFVFVKINSANARVCESIWNPAIQPLKSFYLHNLIAHGHQTWQGGDLLWGVPTGKKDIILWSSGLLKSRDKIKTPSLLEGL